MDDDLKPTNEKIIKVKKWLQIITEKAEKHPKAAKGTLFGIIGTSLFMISMLFDILDENDINFMIKCVYKVILLIFNLIKNNVICVSVLFIVVARVILICYCKRLNDSTKIKEALINKIRDNDENTTIILDEGNKKLQIIIKKDKCSNNSKEKANKKIIPFKNINDLEVK